MPAQRSHAPDPVATGDTPGHAPTLDQSSCLAGQPETSSAVGVSSSFGALLRQFRVDAGLTQEGLAAKAGISGRAIQGLEQRNKQPQRDTVRRLLAALALLPPQRELLEQAAQPRPRGGQAMGRTSRVAEVMRASGFPNHNLPSFPTGLIGREHERQAVRQLLLREDVRLVTLTGPGGAGKTRLALAVAADLLDSMAGGVYSVSLAPVREPGAILAAIAKVLRAAEHRGRSPPQAVTDQIGDKSLLLLLDTFEHVLPAASLLAELLACCPCLKILVTSQTVLHLQGEHCYSVSPLQLPDTRHSPRAEQLQQTAAVRLFVERAKAVQPGFAVTVDNGRTVAEICRRLDGIPLAIELAAARIRVLSPSELLARLERPLSVLTGGSCDLPARQQSLRSTSNWSYVLLPPEQRQLFRRLAVFAGGWTLAAAEAVLAESPTAIVDGLTSLLDRSLILQEVHPDGERRFWMLKTLRDYAREHLERSGEEVTLRRRHASFYLPLAEGAHRALKAGERQGWPRRLAAEQANLQAALAGSANGGGDGEVGVRLAGALRRLRCLQGWTSEGMGLPERLPARTSVPLGNEGPALIQLRDEAPTALAWQGRGQGGGSRDRPLPILGDLGGLTGRELEVLQLIAAG